MCSLCDETDYSEDDCSFEWTTFCNLFYFIGMNNAVVELNKLLLADVEPMCTRRFSAIDISGGEFRA